MADQHGRKDIIIGRRIQGMGHEASLPKGPKQIIQALCLLSRDCLEINLVTLQISFLAEAASQQHAAVSRLGLKHIKVNAWQSF